MQHTVLVTGGAGFIGSHLCEKLLEEGNRVICYDNLMTGTLDNIRSFLSHPSFSFCEGGVEAPFYFEADRIYHLACPASPVHYQHDPVRTGKTNVLGALNVLELAKKTGARVLLTSTSEIYGDPMVHPQTEGYHGNVNPIGLRSCYDEGKRMAETFFFDYHRQYGVDIRVVRIFNTYGPRMHPNDGRVISNFIMQAIRGEDITVYGDGSQTRSCCYVEDMVEALLKMMDKPGITGPLNLGNPEELTIGELAEKVLAMTGAPGRIIYRRLPEDDPTRRRPDISRAKELLDWAPRTPLAEGLAETIAYFRERR